MSSSGSGSRDRGDSHGSVSDRLSVASNSPPVTLPARHFLSRDDSPRSSNHSSGLPSQMTPPSSFPPLLRSLHVDTDAAVAEHASASASLSASSPVGGGGILDRSPMAYTKSASPRNNRGSPSFSTSRTSPSSSFSSSQSKSRKQNGRKRMASTSNRERLSVSSGTFEEKENQQQHQREGEYEKEEEEEGVRMGEEEEEEESFPVVNVIRSDTALGNMWAVVSNPRNRRQSDERYNKQQQQQDLEEIEEDPPSLGPPVTIQDFIPYLKSTAKFYHKYAQGHRRQQSHSHSHAQPHSQQSNSNAVNNLVGNNGTEGSVEDSLSLCLSTVPEMYFRKNFKMSDPSTFSAVTAQPFSNAATSLSGHVVQEQLSNYLDLVEVCLWRQISSRARDIFSALMQLQDLKTIVTHSVKRINRLRDRTVSAQRLIVWGPLKVTHLIRQRARLASIRKTLLLMREAAAAQSTVQQLLKEGDFQSALDLVQSTQAVLKRSSRMPMRSGEGTRMNMRMNGREREQEGQQEGGLLGVVAMNSLGRRLHEFEDLVGQTMARRLVHLAVSWDFAEAGTESHMRMREQVAPLVKGLLRMDRMSKVLALYRQRMTVEVRTVAKTVVSASLDTALTGQIEEEERERERAEKEREKERKKVSEDGDGDGEDKDNAHTKTGTEANRRGSKSSADLSAKAGGEKLRALQPKPFISFLQCVFEHLIIVVRRAAGVHALLVEALSDKEKSEAEAETEAERGKGKEVEAQTATESHHNTEMDARTRRKLARGDALSRLRRKQLEQDSQDVLTAASELAQRSVSQMLQVRRDVHASYRANDLKQLWDHTLAFVTTGEKLSGRTGYGLKGIMLKQAQAFVLTLHKQRVGALVNALDTEEWKQCTVSRHQEFMTRRLYEGWNSDKMVRESERYRDMSTAGTTISTIKGKEKELVLAGQKFKLVGSVFTLISTVGEYLQVDSQFQPALANDILHRVRELLQLFNKRTVKLVLGAGAMTTVKLKSINTKHLALTSQCLGLMILLLPSVRKSLASCLPTKHHKLLAELDQVTKDYTEHREKIFSKFVAIVKDRTEQVCRVVKDINWDDSSESGAPHKYIKSLCHALEMFHKVLSNVLPLAQLQEVFGRMVDMFNERLPELFAPLNPASLSEAGRNAVCADIKALLACLKGLKGLEDPGTKLKIHFQSRFGVDMD